MDWISEFFLYVLFHSGVLGWVIGLLIVLMGIMAFVYGNSLAGAIFTGIGIAIIAAVHWWKRRKRNEIND